MNDSKSYHPDDPSSIYPDSNIDIDITKSTDISGSLNLSTHPFAPDYSTIINNSLNKSLFFDPDSISNSKVEENALNREIEQNELEARDYQLNVVEKAKDQNAILFMDTGTGKTIVSIYLMDHYIKKFQQKKQIVYLANTQVLVEQQKVQIQRFLPKIGAYDIQKIAIHTLHGKVTEYTLKSGLLSSFGIFICTPQFFLNSLRDGSMKFQNVGLLIVDECQHSTKDHPFRLIMKDFYHKYITLKTILNASRIGEKAHKPYILGLTASPIKTNEANEEKIKKKLLELCTTLDSNFVVNDDMMKKSLTEESSRIFVKGYMPAYHTSDGGEKDILVLADQQELFPLFIKGSYFPADDESYNLIQSFHECVLLIDPEQNSADLATSIQKFCNRCLVILMELGRYALYIYIEGLVAKMTEKLMNFEFIKSDLGHAQKLEKLRKCIADYRLAYLPKNFSDDLHCTAKMKLLLSLLSDDSQNSLKTEESLTMVFVSRRYLAKLVAELINVFGKSRNLLSKYVVGHNKGQKDKLNSVMNPTSSLRNQMDTVTAFRTKTFNVLVSTSLCEEGFDIPDCNLVVSFQEPLSITSIIQAKGRARRPNSRYFILTPISKEQYWKGKLILSLKMICIIKQISIELASNPNFHQELRKERILIQKIDDDNLQFRENLSISPKNDLSNDLIHSYCAKMGPSYRPNFITIRTYENSFQDNNFFAVTCMSLRSPIAAVLSSPFSSLSQMQQSTSSEITKALKQKGLLDQTFLPVSHVSKNYEFSETFDWTDLSQVTQIDATQRNQIMQKLTSEFIKQPFVRDYIYDENEKKWIGYLYISSTISAEDNKLDSSDVNSTIGFISPFLLDNEFDTSSLLDDFGAPFSFNYMKEIYLSREEYVQLLWIQRFVLLSKAGATSWYCAWRLKCSFKDLGFYASYPKPNDKVDISDDALFSPTSGRPCYPLMVFLDVLKMDINWAKCKQITSYCNTLVDTFEEFNNNGDILQDGCYEFFIERIKDHQFNLKQFTEQPIIQDVRGLKTLVCNNIKKIDENNIKFKYQPLHIAVSSPNQNSQESDLTSIDYLLAYPLSIEEVRDYIKMETDVGLMKRGYILYNLTLKTQISKKLTKEKLLEYVYQPPSWMARTIRPTSGMTMNNSSSILKDNLIDFNSSTLSTQSIHLPKSQPIKEIKFEDYLFYSNDNLASQMISLCYPKPEFLIEGCSAQIQGGLLISTFCALQTFLQEKSHNSFKNLKNINMKLEQESKLFFQAHKAGLYDLFVMQFPFELLFYKPSFSCQPAFSFLWKYCQYFIKIMLSKFYERKERNISYLIPLLYNWGMLPFSTLSINIEKSSKLEEKLTKNAEVMQILSGFQQQVGYSFNCVGLLFHSLMPVAVKGSLASMYCDFIQRRLTQENGASSGEITSSSATKLEIDYFNSSELKHKEILGIIGKWNTEWTEDLSNDRLRFLGSSLYSLLAIDTYREEESKFLDKKDQEYVKAFLRYVKKPQVIRDCLGDLQFEKTQLGLLTFFGILAGEVYSKWFVQDNDRSSKSYNDSNSSIGSDGSRAPNVPDDETFMALLAAVFIDSGFQISPVRKIYQTYVGARLKLVIKTPFEQKDPVYQLYRYCELNHIGPIVREREPIHDGNPGDFLYKIIVKGKPVAQCTYTNYEHIEERLYAKALEMVQKMKIY